MMMRRSAARLATPAAISAAAAGSNDIQTMQKNVADAVKDATGTVTTPATEYKHVHTVSPPASNFIPSASEAPQLLQSYVEPKPFISPRRMQIFTVSMGVGAASVALVYFFLSQSIGNCVEEEQTQLDRIAERNKLAMQDRLSVVPNFTAPNSYDELYAKMLERNKEVEAQMVQAKSTLHTETMFHVKMWWNRCLRNIQAATDSFATAQLLRKESQTESNIKAALRYSGYDVVSLKKA